MIHPLTLVTFAAFFGAGFYVFQTKEEVVKLDRDLRDIRRQTEAERGRTQTLSAEWARLNDQDRLRAMAASHLRHMQPMEPFQFQRLEDAQRRMPQAVAFTIEPTGFQQRADAPSAPGEVLVFNAMTMRAAAEPARARNAPAQMAAAPAAAPASLPAPAVAATVEAASEGPAVAPILAVARPATVAPVALRPVEAAPRPAPRPRPEVAALPPIAGPTSRPQAPIFQASAPPIRTALHTPAPAGGSLLGGGSSLPPPVPFSR